MRRRAGMTQGELAACLAVSPAAVGAYEQGRRSPSAAMLVALSRALGVSVDYLLTGRSVPERHALAAQMLKMLMSEET